MSRRIWKDHTHPAAIGLLSSFFPQVVRLTIKGKLPIVLTGPLFPNNTTSIKTIAHCTEAVFFFLQNYTPSLEFLSLIIMLSSQGEGMSFGLKVWKVCIFRTMGLILGWGAGPVGCSSGDWGFWNTRPSEPATTAPIKGPQLTFVTLKEPDTWVGQSPTWYLIPLEWKCSTPELSMMQGENS